MLVHYGEIIINAPLSQIVKLQNEAVCIINDVFFNGINNSILTVSLSRLKFLDIVKDVTKTGNGERGAGSGERGTEVWKRVVSRNLHKNPKWRSKTRERERGRQRKEFVPWLKSGGDEIANQTHILRLRFEQVVCFFDIQPVSFTI